jgi:hypothetical protein
VFTACGHRATARPVFASARLRDFTKIAHQTDWNLGKKQNTFPKNIFFKNSPEIACQAPKPPNSLKQNKIELGR